MLDDSFCVLSISTIALLIGLHDVCHCQNYDLSLETKPVTTMVPEYINDSSISIATTTSTVSNVRNLPTDEDDEEWIAWKALYHPSLNRVGKTSLTKENDTEAARRYRNFRRSRDFVNEYKKQQSRGDFDVSLNQLADLDDEELARYRSGLVTAPRTSSTTSTTVIRTRTRSTWTTTTSPRRTRPPTTTRRTRPPTTTSRRIGTTPRRPNVAPVYVLPDDVIESLDWRLKGAVSPVKNQGMTCGACYAFSVTGVLESRLYLKTGKMVLLSEQNLVDCSVQFGNNGCIGGDTLPAFRYVEAVGGINSNEAYPYVGEGSRCKFNSSATARYASMASPGFIEVERGTEDALMEALQSGPVSVAIDASHTAFLYYSSGVYWEADCQADRLQHAMLLVGYGTDEITKQPYWLIKNSFGTSWGEDGYIRIFRGSNMCGIASYGIYPVLS